VLAAFGLMVGPLGWWYMVRKKQRGLFYYVLAPAVSLCVIVLIIVADVFYEGVRPRVSSAGVRLLDQRVQKVIETSQFGVYAPFAVGQMKGSADEVRISSPLPAATDAAAVLRRAWRLKPWQGPILLRRGACPAEGMVCA